MTLDELKARLKEKAPNEEGVGCTLCGLILRDLKENGRPTGNTSVDPMGNAMFPPESQLKHLQLEGFPVVEWSDGVQTLSE